MIGRARFRLVAFDLLAVGGDDIRSDPFHARIAGLAKLGQSRRRIHYNEHMEEEIGVAMFEHACKLGLEGSYRSIGTAPIVRRLGYRDRPRATNPTPHVLPSRQITWQCLVVLKPSSDRSNSKAAM